MIAPGRTTKKPKWLDDYYNTIENEQKRKRQKKGEERKLTKQEFMEKYLNGKCDRIPEGSGASDGDLLVGEMEEPHEETP